MTEREFVRYENTIRYLKEIIPAEEKDHKKRLDNMSELLNSVYGGCIPKKFISKNIMLTARLTR